MHQRRKIIRAFRRGSFSGNININGLWSCKRGCDLKHPTNSTKRQACKDKCEADNLASATTLYPTTTTTTSPTTTTPPLTSGDGLIMGLDQNELLMYGGGALALLYIMKNKKKKKRK